MNPRIPVRHDGRHPDEVRPGKGAQSPAKTIGLNAEAIVAAGDFTVGGGLFHRCSRELSRTVFPIRPGKYSRPILRERIMSLHTIDESHPASPVSKECAQGEKPQGLGPQVMSGKIRDPGIDQEDKRGF
jgi:hypothetical protein